MIHLCLLNVVLHLFELSLPAFTLGLVFLLAAGAWKLLAVQKKEGLVVSDDDDAMNDAGDEDDMDEEVKDHIVIRLRNRVVTIVELCFGHFLDSGDKEFSHEQIEFADRLQTSASMVSSDLRTLFIREMENAASPLLRSFALREDVKLLSGNVRFFRSKEEEVR